MTGTATHSRYLEKERWKGPKCGDCRSERRASHPPDRQRQTGRGEGSWGRYWEGFYLIVQFLLLRGWSRHTESGTEGRAWVWEDPSKVTPGTQAAWTGWGPQREEWLKLVLETWAESCVRYYLKPLAWISSTTDWVKLEDKFYFIF